MATDRMALVDVLRKGQDPEADLLQEGVRWFDNAWRGELPLFEVEG